MASYTELTLNMSKRSKRKRRLERKRRAATQPVAHATPSAPHEPPRDRWAWATSGPVALLSLAIAVVGLGIASWGVPTVRDYYTPHLRVTSTPNLDSKDPFSALFRLENASHYDMADFEVQCLTGSLTGNTISLSRNTFEARPRLQFLLAGAEATESCRGMVTGLNLGPNVQGNMLLRVEYTYRGQRRQQRFPFRYFQYENGAIFLSPGE